jgi:hypothetical protein
MCVAYLSARRRWRHEDWMGGGGGGVTLTRAVRRRVVKAGESEACGGGGGGGEVRVVVRARQEVEVCGGGVSRSDGEGARRLQESRGRGRVGGLVVG